MQSGSPVQKYVAEPIVMDLDPTREQQTTLFLQNAYTQRYDNAFTYWAYFTETFYQITNIKQASLRINTNTLAVASVRIKMDYATAVHGRDTQTFFSGLAHVGGFAICLYIIGYILVFFVQEKLFKGSFLR